MGRLVRDSELSSFCDIRHFVISHQKWQKEKLPGTATGANAADGTSGKPPVLSQVQGMGLMRLAMGLWQTAGAGEEGRAGWFGAQQRGKNIFQGMRTSHGVTEPETVERHPQKGD